MRQYIRHHAGIPLEIIHDDQQYRYILQNVSLGGIACHGSHGIDKNCVVNIRMHLLQPVYESQGRVVWCKQTGEDYELGIEHIGDKDKPRLNMVEQISHIEHYLNEVRISEGRNLDGEEAAREWVAIHGSNYS